MSLINEALKKAQDKTGAAPAAPKPITAPQSVPVRGRPSLPTFVVVILGSGVSFLFFGILWFLITSAVARRTPEKILAAKQPSPPVKAEEATMPSQAQLPASKPHATTAATLPSSVPAQPVPVAPAPAVPQAAPPPSQPAVVSEGQPLEPPKPAPPKVQRPALKLNATSVFKDSRVAFINDQKVYEGDEIEGATVISIRRNGVLMRFAGEEFFLRLD